MAARLKCAKDCAPRGVMSCWQLGRASSGTTDWPHLGSGPLSDSADTRAEDAASSVPGLVLTGQQQTLLAALIEKDSQLGKIYLGGLHVLHQEGNPDREALAAHAIRELMEKLPQFVDLPTLEKPKKPVSLNVKVRELSGHWARVSTEVMTETVITAKIKKFHIKTNEFFDWFEQSFATRRDQTAVALRRLDATGRSLPTPIEDLHIKHWVLCSEFFQGVSHHGRLCSQEEFASWLDDLERFLLDRMRPRTFETFSILDEIIAEGETDA